MATGIDAAPAARASVPATSAPTALVTGSAGFIGYHVCRRLLADGFRVLGLDAMTSYYDVALKRRRHAMLLQSEGFSAHEARVEAPGTLEALMAEARPGLVVHLAAQAGVRHSIEAPESYLDANLAGTFRLLEAARAMAARGAGPAHMLLASTSSVYGANSAMPYAETDRIAHPMSFYAATKAATEGMAHSYAHLYGLPMTMFRFFTVYGPWGRPDMAPTRFAAAVLAGEPIEVYGMGQMSRDFTYVDDLVEAVRRLADLPPAAQGAREGLADGRWRQPFAGGALAGGQHRRRAAHRARATSSPRSRPRRAGAPSGGSCRCSPATWPRPGPAPGSSAASPATSPTPPWRRACAASSPGTGTTPAPERPRSRRRGPRPPAARSPRRRDRPDRRRCAGRQSAGRP